MLLETRMKQETEEKLRKFVVTGIQCELLSTT